MASQKQAYSFDVLLSHRHGMHTTAISRLDSFDLASDARNNHSKTFHPPSDTPDLLTDYACQWVYLNPGLTFFQIRSLACWILRTACRLVEPDGDKLTAPSAPDEMGSGNVQSSPVASQRPRGLTAMIRFYAVLSPPSAQPERFPDCETAREMLAGLHAHLFQAQKFFHRRAVLKERPAELVKRCFVLPVLEFCLMDWEISRGRRGVLLQRESEDQSTRSLVEDIKRDIRRETVERVRSGPSLQKHRMAGGKASVQHRTDRVPDGTDFWTLPRPQSHLGPIRKPTSPADAVDERRRIDIADPIISAFEGAESLVKLQISLSPPTPPPSPFRPIGPALSPPPTPPASPASPAVDVTTPARQDSLQSAGGQLDQPPDVEFSKTEEVAKSKEHLRREASGFEKVTGEEAAARNVQPPRFSLPGYCVCCGVMASSSRH
ncbi:hypothetical protein KC332_g14414 [Hortaea werneckii]|nr:hypothetical protein KC358_g14447 [Hortaea werneckii]KAI6806394.1 hypothetical protein KC350_g14185 [Hortaea werneckii]KAI6906309.1 hypothetical protein KC348_g14691 [Hortaea werneckii]KAI6924313.1 hypothetical protein KC341_g14143 [Hortaea werneckii]KAI6957895.1 hypothetical protein KC321_g14323 [Hortaea werneckii]